MTGNPAAGVLVLLVALYLLLALVGGRLEWLFALPGSMREPGGPGDPGDLPAELAGARRSTVWRARPHA